MSWPLLHSHGFLHLASSAWLHPPDLTRGATQGSVIGNYLSEYVILPSFHHHSYNYWPLPWLAPLLNGVEHANFFETRATEYSKGATRGDWNRVWDSFDERKKDKANHEEGEDQGEDMFGNTGVAAE